MLKRKKWMVSLISILVCVIMVLPFAVACDGAQETETFEFSYNNILPPGGWSEEWAQKYCDDIYELTEGRVTINLFMGGALGKPQDAVELLNTGVTDIVYHSPIFTPGQFPLSEVAGLPYICNQAADVADLMYDILAWDKTTEYDNFKVVAFLPTNPVNFYFRDKEVKTTEDMEGMKIRAAGGGPYAAAISALGATPASIPTADVYMSLDRGLVDGLSTNSAFLTQIKGWEVLEYSIRDGVNGGLHLMLMSKASWDSLPSDLQDIIDDYNNQYWRDYLEFNIAEDGRAFDELIANGIEIYELSPDELASWQELTEPIITEWEEAANEAGLPGTETIAKARQYGSR